MHDVEEGAELGGHRHVAAVQLEGGAVLAVGRRGELEVRERAVHAERQPGGGDGARVAGLSSECRPYEKTSAAGASSAMRARAASSGSSA